MENLRETASRETQGSEKGLGPVMRLLLPAADWVADHLHRQLPSAKIVRCGDACATEFASVTLYCLPYMGDAASVALVGDMPRLRVVQALGTGVDEVRRVLPPEVTLCNGRGFHREGSTAELAITLILESLRQLPQFVRQQAQAQWRHDRTDSLDGKRVLLVGYGAIGAAIDRRLNPFGATVTRVPRTPRAEVKSPAHLSALAASTDILVVCIALADASRGLVDITVLSALPDSALVVNVARGPVVDMAALARELESGHLGAALDVTDPEPLPPDRPEWTLPNVLLTPHIAGDTLSFACRAPPFAADLTARHLAGQELLNVVVPTSL